MFISGLYAWKFAKYKSQVATSHTTCSLHMLKVCSDCHRTYVKVTVERGHVPAEPTGTMREVYEDIGLSKIPP